MEQIDISHRTVEDLHSMFSYGFISYKDLKEELNKRSLDMDIHGDIRYQDGELYDGGMININNRPEEGPIENRWQILDL